MKVISFDKIKELCISPLQCYQWVSDAIEKKNDALLPAKISMKPEIPGVFYNTMPVIFPPEHWGGVKLVTRYPERIPSLDSQILLYDLTTGKNLALLDGNWITAMRTGAVAAHSICLLAKKDFKKLGFIGLGNTARAALNILLAVYPERDFTIRLKRYKEQHEIFAKRYNEYKNVKFVYCDTFEDVIMNSEVVVSAATVFNDDICEDKYYKEGILLVPIHTRGFTNCDLFFDKIYADDINHVKSFKYFDRYKFFAETCEVVNNSKVGRESDKERIIAYNIGIALHDIYFAGKIYELIGESCPDVLLNAPTEKFWV